MMGEPARSLRVLVVAAGPAEADVLRDALARFAGAPWTVEAALPDDCIRRLGTTPADAVLLDL
ncbi:MAG TPA: hypothetical protein VFX28_24575, partial [Methylomirabilota bacterium]|nr:hypothetical protein [Methylomirabilota bacterium]